MAGPGTGTIYMTAKIFIDTNILVYALDQYDPEKQHKSRTILRQVAQGPGGVISTQVMEEILRYSHKKA